MSDWKRKQIQIKTIIHIVDFHFQHYWMLTLKHFFSEVIELYEGTTNVFTKALMECLQRGFYISVWFLLLVTGHQ